MRGEGRSVCHDYREKIGGVLLDNWKESRETTGYICPLTSFFFHAFPSHSNRIVSLGFNGRFLFSR